MHHNLPQGKHLSRLFISLLSQFGRVFKQYLYILGQRFKCQKFSPKECFPKLRQKKNFYKMYWSNAFQMYRAKINLFQVFWDEIKRCEGVSNSRGWDPLKSRIATEVTPKPTLPSLLSCWSILLLFEICLFDSTPKELHGQWHQTPTHVLFWIINVWDSTLRY